MELRYDEDFLEATVQHCTSAREAGIPQIQIARFHRERERLYAIADPDDRSTAFFQLYLEWFREWGVEQLLLTPLQHYPLLPRKLKVLAFRRSRARRDDGAELYVNEAGDRSAVISLRPQSVRPGSALNALLHDELSHVQDMVDPAFGYRPDLAVGALSPGQQLRAVERYRMLWAVTIDGRLSRAGRPRSSTRERRWWEFSEAFGCWIESERQEVFERLWNQVNPSHAALLELVHAARKRESGDGPAPGAGCPLCGFPTFAWAEPSALGEPVATAIRREFPNWSVAQGACARCVAIYRLKRSPVMA